MFKKCPLSIGAPVRPRICDHLRVNGKRHGHGHARHALGNLRWLFQKISLLTVTSILDDKTSLWSPRSAWLQPRTDVKNTAFRVADVTP